MIIDVYNFSPNILLNISSYSGKEVGKSKKDILNIFNMFALPKDKGLGLGNPVLR